ncbi:YhdH/YhfP family quinone oxidoreductase [Liquorilactobacillus mali]|uniref:YhdH/YhfP family quinone oxidoreductase n=1 Tax=Liquorilactobacillus mali TaxID=1618 RepID=UPI0023508720|nr:YhdH/YhfP family quinone oxidoreductase [Liquorilactobacillus mali]MDC7953407.1 YhdH/YhfP family quinone oxidoreductase [Liquorilactobacillus mali]
MVDKLFKTLIVNKSEDMPKVQSELKKITLADLSEGDVVVKIAYSSLNYKDVLAFQNNSGVIRKYPMIPGVDFCGTVIETSNPRFTTGENVLCTGYDVGVSHTGGLSEYARVPAEWLIRLDKNVPLEYVMALGTAGLTAALSVNEIVSFGAKRDSEILVTGVTGGVGSIVVAILKKLKMRNISVLVRNKDQRHSYCNEFKNVYLRDDLETKKLIAHQKFDYVVDCVGGTVLEAVLPWVSYKGVVTVCGNIAGNQLKTNMLPFILRGIRLMGIDSVNIKLEEKEKMWQQLLTDWNINGAFSVRIFPLDKVKYVVDNWVEVRNKSRIVISVPDTKNVEKISR